MRNNTLEEYYKFLLDFKKAEIGLVNPDADFSKIENVRKEINIKSFDNPGEPLEIELVIPSTFFLNKLENLTYKFSKIFTIDSNFEIINFDYPTRTLTIKRETDLPQKILWDEKYIDKNSNFIPLGIGNNNKLIGYSPTQYEDKKIDVISPHLLVTGVLNNSMSILLSIIKTALAKNREVYILSPDNPKATQKLKEYKKSSLNKFKNLTKFLTNELSVRGQIDDLFINQYLEMSDLLLKLEKILDNRFKTCENLGINNIAEIDNYNNESDLKDIFVVIPFINELFIPLKTKNKDFIYSQEENKRIIEKLCRVGRSMGIHVVMSSQRPDSSIIPMQIKQNISTRIAVGKIPRTISQIVLESNVGETIPDIPNRSLIKTHLMDAVSFQAFDHE